MIKSNKVDLTIDRKFGKDTRFDLFSNNRVGLISSFVSMYIKPSDSLPWVRKEHEIYAHNKLYTRSYNDKLSNDCGTTLRLTEDNTILMLGQRLRPELLEELMLECIGWFPYQSIAMCLHCGRKKIRSLKYKNAYDSCVNDRLERIPWKRTIH